MTVAIEQLDHEISLVDLLPQMDPSEVLGLDRWKQMSAECWSGYVDDRLICCWGLIPPSLLSSQAYLWMYSTTEVENHKFLLVRHSQRIIEQALDHYATVVGHCKAESTNSIRWLQWLGATFAPVADGFCAFTIRRK